MPSSPSPSEQDEYATIEAAVMETARGRWFLAEHARRHRAADTVAVLEAIGRLEVGLAARPSEKGESLRLEVVDIANAIARAKAEIAAIRPDDGDGQILDATNELDAIVKATEKATGDILAAAEHLQEVAWTLREAGFEGAACDIIDQRATDIYMACSFQDITGQRTQKVIQVLRYIENRLDAMMAIWAGGATPAAPAPPPMIARGDGLLNGPALPGQGLDQSDVDSMMGLSTTPTEEAPVLTSSAEAAEEPVAIEESIEIGQPVAIEETAAIEESIAIEQPVAIEETAAIKEPPAFVEPVSTAVAAPVTVVTPAAIEPEVPTQAEVAEIVPPAEAPVETPAILANPAAIPAPTAPARPEPPPIYAAPQPPSPFAPVVKPAPRKPAQQPGPTLEDVEALSFDEKAALFS